MAGVEEITVTGTTEGRFCQILTPEAIAFVVQLDREFGARRMHLLDRSGTSRTRPCAGTPAAVALAA